MHITETEFHFCMHDFSVAAYIECNFIAMHLDLRYHFDWKKKKQQRLSVSRSAKEAQQEQAVTESASVPEDATNEVVKDPSVLSSPGKPTAINPYQLLLETFSGRASCPCFQNYSGTYSVNRFCMCFDDYHFSAEDRTLHNLAIQSWTVCLLAIARPFQRVL